MRLDELPMKIIGAQVMRLAAAFGGKPKAELEQFGAELQRAVYGWTETELATAVSSAIDQAPHFPRIAAIKAHFPARPVLPEGDAKDGQHCGACREHYYYAGYQLPDRGDVDGPVMPKLRCGCPPPAGFLTARARAWRETDAPLIEAGYVTTIRREDWSA